MCVHIHMCVDVYIYIYIVLRVCTYIYICYTCTPSMDLLDQSLSNAGIGTLWGSESLGLQQAPGHVDVSRRNERLIRFLLAAGGRCHGSLNSQDPLPTTLSETLIICIACMYIYIYTHVDPQSYLHLCQCFLSEFVSVSIERLLDSDHNRPFAELRFGGVLVQAIGNSAQARQ